MEEKKLTWREREREAFKDMILHYSSEIEELGKMVEMQRSLIDTQEELIKYMKKDIKSLKKNFNLFVCNPN
jgi:peptidoglycan hydrolase CwlO-like protein